MNSAIAVGSAEMASLLTVDVMNLLVRIQPSFTIASPRAMQLVFATYQGSDFRRRWNGHESIFACDV